MSLNSLFFNYDKLAKDGVVETIDWRNPPDSDDDNNDDDGIRTLDDTVNDVNDKIKRSDDIAADLKRTIDSIKQSGKVSQEDRIALEAFTKSVDFKGLPSMESYTVAPSRVNYDKTLTVSMEVHKLLVAGGIAAIIVLISKIFGFIGGDDSDNGGGGGSTGSGKDKQGKAEKAKETYEANVKKANKLPSGNTEKFNRALEVLGKLDREKDPDKRAAILKKHSDKTHAKDFISFCSKISRFSEDEFEQTIKRILAKPDTAFEAYISENMYLSLSTFLINSVYRKPGGVSTYEKMIGSVIHFEKNYLNDINHFIRDADRLDGNSDVVKKLQDNLNNFDVSWVSEVDVSFDKIEGNTKTAKIRNSVSEASHALINLATPFNKSDEGRQKAKSTRGMTQNVITNVIMGTWFEVFMSQDLNVSCERIGNLSDGIKKSAKTISNSSDKEVEALARSVRDISVSIIKMTHAIKFINGTLLHFAQMTQAASSDSYKFMDLIMSDDNPSKHRII